MPTKRRPAIIAHHLIWTLYGHWLPNDLRGSGSEELRDPKFNELGDIHHGRKPRHLQPSRKELREFHQQAEPLLQFPRFWIDEAKRQAIGKAIAQVVAERSYTVWACAILSNHVHIVIRIHRDDALAIWSAIAEAVRLALRRFADVGHDHPVLAAAVQGVFAHARRGSRSRRLRRRQPIERGPSVAALRFRTIVQQLAIYRTENGSVIG
jgi:REP element-mobilizing transposase RayT